MPGLIVPASPALIPSIVPTLIMAGDSQIADGYQGGGNGTSYFGRVAIWVRTKIHGRFNCDLESGMFATSGFNSTQWITTHLANCVGAVKAAVAAGSQPVVLMKLGTNDCGGGFAYATSKGNFDTIFAALTGAGAIVCPVLILPRGTGSALSANGEKLRHGLNAYFSALRYTNGGRVIPIDTIRVMTNGDGTPLSGVLIDGLHPTPIGADIEATPIAAVLNALCPFDTVPDFLNASDVYDATYAPFGNRVVNGSMSGTGGGTDNAQATGTWPTSWKAGGWTTPINLSGASTKITGVGSSVVSSLDVPNTPMCQIALGGTASSDFFVLEQAASLAGAATGEKYIGGCVFEWDAGLANVAAVYFGANFGYQGQCYEGASLDGVQPLPSAARRLVLVSNPVTLSAAGNTNLFMRIGVQGSNLGAPSGNVRIGHAFVLKAAGSCCSPPHRLSPVRGVPDLTPGG